MMKVFIWAVCYFMNYPFGMNERSKRQYIGANWYRWSAIPLREARIPFEKDLWSDIHYVASFVAAVGGI